jgi:hypothetical protein
LISDEKLRLLTKVNLYCQTKVSKRILEEDAKRRQEDAGKLYGENHPKSQELVPNLEQALKEIPRTLETLSEVLNIPKMKLDTIIELGELAETGKPKDVRKAEKKIKQIEEMKFDCRSDAIVWMIDNQKNKRNANKMTLTYLIGKQYREQKNIHGVNRYTSKSPQNEDSTKTGQKIATQSGVSHATVERAATFSENPEKICENAGIKRQEILLGNIDATMKDVNDLAEHDEPNFHKIAVEKVLSKEVKDLKKAISNTDKEFRDERAKQLEEEKKKLRIKELEKLKEENRLAEEKKRIEEEQRLIEEEKNRDFRCKYKISTIFFVLGSFNLEQFNMKYILCCFDWFESFYVKSQKALMFYAFKVYKQ